MAKKSRVESNENEMVDKNLLKDNKELKEKVMKDDLHIIDVATLLNRLGVKDVTKGLSELEVQKILARNGPNIIANKCCKPSTTIDDQNELKHIFKHLFTGFARILWIVVALCLLAYLHSRFIEAHQHQMIQSHFDYLMYALAITVLIIFTGSYSYLQEVYFTRTAPDTITERADEEEDEKERIFPVIRNRKEKYIPARSIVVGDIINLESGDHVPADIRILKINSLIDLQLNTTAFTGCANTTISVSVNKDLTCEQNFDGNDDDSHNVAFCRTKVVEGKFTGVVIRTGNQTVIGQSLTEKNAAHVSEGEPSPAFNLISKAIHMWTTACFPGSVDDYY